MSEFELPYETFIGGWFIDESICDRLIDFFESKSDYHFKGNASGHEVDTDLVDDTRINLSIDDLPDDYAEALSGCLNKYKKRYEYCDNVTYYSLQNCINIQKYSPGGGYKVWHFEENGDDQKRHLVFMTFLNDVPDGGTQFKYQNLTIPAIKGLTLIWPAPWTHTHRGQVSQTHTKYIITGWYNFNE